MSAMDMTQHDNPEPKKAISRHLIEELIKLESKQNDYVPGPEIAKQLEAKKLLLIVAPTSMGKSTVIKRVTQLDDRFGTVGSFTTRTARPDENGKAFTYIPHDDDGLKLLFARIQKKEIVQYIVHPTTKHVYGTDISHYPKEYNLLDYVANGVAGIRKLPFAASPVISIATEPSQWIYWFNQRFPEGNPERHRRRDEAISCLRWLLGQQINDVHWVFNSPGVLDHAANQVIQIGLGSKTNDLNARQFAEQCLHEAYKIK